jgi:uncharacterized protein YcgL (UPF0745 family)
MKKSNSLAQVVWPFSKTPEGKVFNGKKAEKVINEWKDEQQVVLKKQGSFIEVAKKTENRLRSMSKDIEASAKEVKAARKGFEGVTSGVAKARWARRLILATELHSYNRNSQQLLNSTVERVKDAIEDGRIVIQLINNQIKDAELYYQINGQVKLVGQALAAAKSRHILPDVEFTRLESTIESVEADIDNQDPEALIKQAQFLLEDNLDERTN